MSTLDSILKETRLFPPSDDFRHRASVSGMDAYNGLCEQADDHYLSFWGDIARELITWKKPFSRVLDDSNAPFFKWFDDTLERLTNSYESGVKWVTRSWARGLVVFAVVVLGCVGLFKLLPTAFVPQEDQGYLFVGYFLPDSASLDRTNAVGAQAVLLPLPRVGRHVHGHRETQGGAH